VALSIATARVPYHPWAPRASDRVSYPRYCPCSSGAPHRAETDQLRAEIDRLCGLLGARADGSTAQDDDAEGRMKQVRMHRPQQAGRAK